MQLKSVMIQTRMRTTYVIKAEYNEFPIGPIWQHLNWSYFRLWKFASVLFNRGYVLIHKKWVQLHIILTLLPGLKQHIDELSLRLITSRVRLDLNYTPAMLTTTRPANS